MSLLAMKDEIATVEPGISRLLAQASRFLTGQGIPYFLVGGFVRDILLRRPTRDIDIAVKADAVLLAPELAAALGGKAIILDKVNRISRLVFPGGGLEIDLTSFTGTIEEDLARRDFTANAIAAPFDDTVGNGFDPSRFIDPFFGRKDIENKLIRTVSDGVFIEDPARLLRAVRIAAELDFNIETGTAKVIRRDAFLLAAIAGERIREEFLRLLTLPGAGERLFQMDQLGLLMAVIPELAPARGVDQPRIHVWDVLEHSIRTVTAVEFVLREGGWKHAPAGTLDQVPWSGELESHFSQPVSSGSSRKTLLKLGALLHDIAKPQTKTLDDDGRARFTGHPNEGAVTAAAIMERLRFSRKEIGVVELLVKYHMRPNQMSNEGLPTGKAIYRYFRDTGETGTDILFLCLADHLATRGTTLDLDEWQRHTALTSYILAEHEDRQSPSRAPRLIDGNDIIAAFGLQPGPELGRLLEAAREAQAAGEIIDRQQALAYIQHLMARPDNVISDTPSQGEL